MVTVWFQIDGEAVIIWDEKELSTDEGLIQVT